MQGRRAMLALALLFILAAAALAAAGTPAPQIRNAYVSPTKVVPGDRMLIYAEVSDICGSGLEKATADMEVEAVDMQCEPSFKPFYICNATWAVHSTTSRNYTTAITVRNKCGQQATAYVVWEDPAAIQFVSPSDADNASISIKRNYTYANLSVTGNTTGMFNVIVNWNGTNVTVDSPDLLLSLNLNNNTNDSSRYGNGLNNTGASCSTSVTGKFSGACQFDGTDDVLGKPDIAGTPLDIGGAFTMMFWMYATGSGSDAGLVGTGIDNYQCTHHAGTTVYCYIQGGGNNVNTPVTTNEWHHITFMFNGTTDAGGQRLYVDGALKATRASTSAAISGSTTLRVGQESSYFPGFIDEVRLWNRTISEAEINATYQAELGRIAGPVLSYYTNFTNLAEGNYTYFIWTNDTAGSENSTLKTGLVADYTLPTPAFTATSDPDNASGHLKRNFTYVNFTVAESGSPVDTVIVNWNGTNVSVDDPSLVLALDFNNNTNDRSRYGNAVNNSGANCSSLVAGRFGGACSVNGSPSYLSVPDRDAYDFDTAQPFTVMFWTKWQDGYDHMDAIVEKWDGNEGYPFVFRAISGGKVWFARYDGTNNPAIASDTNAFSDFQWHQVVGLLNTSSDKIELYVDGRLHASASDTTTATTKNSDAIYIGSRGGSSLFFNGSVDELRIWNRTLTYAEINASYNAELGRVNGTTLSYFANFTSLAKGNFTYYVFVNDSAGNQNTTPQRSFMVNNSCTYTGGKWTVMANEQCFIKSPVDLGTNDFELTNCGSGGSFTAAANIVSVGNVRINSGCRLVVQSGKAFG